METKPSYISREESFEIENPDVHIEVISGNVRVIASEDGRCHVEVSTSPENSKDLEDLVEISANRSHLKIQVGWKNGGFRALFSGRSHDFDVTVSLPRTAILKVNGVSANINVNQTVLSIEIRSVSGNVTVLQNPTTTCSIKSVSGEITAHTFSACTYSLKSVSGDIRVNVAPGLEVDVDGKSISGDLESEISLSSGDDSQTKNAECVTISASTVSGDISLARS